MTSDLDVRCLNAARDFRGTDAGSLLIQAADEIASLRTHFDQQLSIATEAVSQLERLRAENERLTAALKAAEPHVRATNESEHMMDGFGGVRERPSDLDLDLVQRALTNGER